MLPTIQHHGEIPQAARAVKAWVLPVEAFPLPLHLESTGPGLAVLRAPFVFLSPTLGRIEVEAGFDTDYASIPRLFWSLYRPDGSYTPAAVIHDALYFYGLALRAGGYGPVITRAEADAVFLEAMVALGEPLLRRRILYTGVRVGGWVAWNRNARWHAEQREEAATLRA